jgi:hypothetical protein
MKPYMLMLLPIRANLRMLRLLLMCTKSNTLSVEPILAMPKTLIDDPILAKLLALIALPMCVKSSTLSPLAMRAMP